MSAVPYKHEPPAVTVILWHFMKSFSVPVMKVMQKPSVRMFLFLFILISLVEVVIAEDNLLQIHFA